MDNLKIVYKIQVGIEASMDSPVFGRNRILQSMILILMQFMLTQI
ncbi:hypothetical protein [Peptostreptococcus anaerobius]|nr:hypothetical protein [Peptostreptococcus anaerobius]MCQ5151072.1 hypothetical protein [Peptostreptococcus anaerobius]